MDETGKMLVLNNGLGIDGLYAMFETVLLVCKGFNKIKLKSINLSANLKSGPCECVNILKRDNNGLFV